MGYMEVQQFLVHIVVYLGVSLLIVPIALRFKLGSIIGYLLTGILIGPNMLKFVDDPHGIFDFAEFGVVILLFLIGLELNPKKLWQMKRPIFQLGALQVCLVTLVLAIVIRLFFGLQYSTSFLIAFALSMSSTAFAIQLMKDFSETNSEQGRSAFAVLLFQDLSVIPALALIPVLFISSATENEGGTLSKVAMSLGAIVAIILVGRYIVRHVFRIIAVTRIRELFTALALFIVIGTALIMSKVGLSMALGAFLAGVLLAESEYRHEIEADLEPFKGLLLGLFFISVGMALNISLLYREPLKVFGILFALVTLKFGIHFLVAKISGIKGIAALKFSALLAQGGEFAFVLFGVLQSQKLVESATIEPFSVAVTLSMGLSPLLYSYINNLACENELENAREFDKEFDQNPVIIAGYGRFGQIIGRVLRMKKIGITGLENNPENIDTLRRFGNKIFYGDASRLDLLHAAGAEKAKLFVLAIDDVESSVETARIVRTHFPNLPILARARNRQHVFRLRDLGVQTVIRETFFSGLAGAKTALTTLGDTDLSAEIATNYFRENDEKLLDEQYKNYDSEEHLVAVSKIASEQLIQAFESDIRE